MKAVNTADACLGLVAASILLSACSSEPSATVSAWEINRERSGTGYSLTATATLTEGDTGWFTPEVELVDERGCRRIETFSSIQPAAAADPELVAAQISERFDYKWKVARAEFRLRHKVANTDLTEPGQVVFSGGKVIDSALKPGAKPAVIETI